MTLLLLLKSPAGGGGGGGGDLIEVTAPVADARLLVGETVTIEINVTPGVVSPFDVLLSLDGGATFPITLLSDAAAIDLEWTITSAHITPTAVLRVQEAADAMVFGDSDEFVIATTSTACGGGLNGDQQAQLDYIETQVALLSAGRSPQVISPVADGGTITAFIESDYRVRSGTQLRIPVSDAGSVLHTKLTAIGVENLAFGAARANKPAGEILGSVASLSYASSVTTISIEITACGAGLRPDEFIWQIQSSQTHSAEFDDAIEVSGILQLMRRTVPAKG